ncbi:Uncharacterised protein [uncultured archaeon]|nr:Uncharacterised protein [uncultured archaeon]
MPTLAMPPPAGIAQPKKPGKRSFERNISISFSFSIRAPEKSACMQTANSVSGRKPNHLATDEPAPSAPTTTFPSSDCLVARLPFTIFAPSFSAESARSESRRARSSTCARGFPEETSISPILGEWMRATLTVFRTAFE